MNTYSFEIRQGTQSIVRVEASSLNEAMTRLAMNACELCSEEPFKPEVKLVETSEHEKEAFAK